MRELWRNREVRIQAGLWLAAGILLGTAGFCLNRAAGGMAVAVWAVLTVLNWGNVIRRYREIRRLSEETDSSRRRTAGIGRMQGRRSGGSQG